MNLSGTQGSTVTPLALLFFDSTVGCKSVLLLLSNSTDHCKSILLLFAKQ
jgi:hypothetical protein